MLQNGLTTTQFAVLEALLHLGPLSQTVISKKLLVSGGNVVTVIDNLERDGLVVRQPNPRDRRAYQVTLTQKGEQIIKLIFSDHVRVIEEAFSVLNETEQLELNRLCKKLGLGQKIIEP